MASADEFKEVIRHGAEAALRYMRENATVVAAPFGVTVRDELLRQRARLSVIPEQALLTECMQDIMEVMSDTCGRVKTVTILHLLDHAGKLHGMSTVKRALSQLVKDGLLNSYRKGGSGYTLPSKEYSLFDVEDLAG